MSHLVDVQGGNVDEFTDKSNVLAQISYINLTESTTQLLNNIAELQENDGELNDYIQTRIVGRDNPTFKQHEGIWFQQPNECVEWKLVIPSEIQRELIESEHTRLCHAGVSKTLNFLKKNFWFKYMEKMVKQVIQCCDLCQRVKPMNQNIKGDFEMVSATKPRELVTVDYNGPLPESTGKVKYIFVIIDAFSKLIKLYPMVSAKTKPTLKRLIHDYSHDVGKPRSVLADNGTQFT